MDFSWHEIEEVSYLSYEPWRVGGIQHGFVGNSLGFRIPKPSDGVESELELDTKRLCDRLQLSQLLFVEQTHSNSVLWLDPKVVGSGTADQPMEMPGFLGEADGILVDYERFSGEGAVAVGIRTADCLPILIRMGDVYGLVHAGWRGLAIGIVQNALRQMCERARVTDGEVVVGPCAGDLNYEVGPEVIEAIGEHASFEETEQKKFRLSLVDSVRKIIRAEMGDSLRFIATRICTIDSPKLHSFRRDGTGRGSNLCFLVVGANAVK